MPPALLCSRVNLVGAAVLLRAVADGVVNRGAEGLGRGNSLADLHCFHRLQRHHRPGEQSVQPLIPVGIGAEARQARREPLLRRRRRWSRRCARRDRLPPSSALRLRDRRSSTGSHRVWFSAAISSQEAMRGSSARPTRTTWLPTSMPSEFNSNLAMAPAATRAVDSRAEARSST